MGMWVEVHKYDLEDIFAELARGATRNKENIATLVVNAAYHFGTLRGTSLYLMWNDFAEDYNPEAQFIVFCTRYFGCDDLSLKAVDETVIPPSANADEVAERLGVELPEEDDE